jgi:hypothetical protein
MALEGLNWKALIKPFKGIFRPSFMGISEAILRPQGFIFLMLALFLVF